MATTPHDAPEAGQPYLPTPQAEAQAFAWDDLLTPTRQGLRELFSWLEAACEGSAEAASTEHLSTSLLVSGARGSGKTTLLLSAVQALRDWKSFVRGAPGPEVPALSRTLERLERRILWLEPLDLEPVPTQANLLATLLVRVRAALDQPRRGKGARGESSRWASSILEEGAEETWGKLDHLIRDASFMWEDIPTTTDARVRAEQQIRASEIYANFQPRFADAMEDVARTLSMPRFGASGGDQVLLVLPIDNVDRSIEHLYNIVKLTRMVASRHLWFVLAAGHQEFQRFMERSFQKELIISGQAGIGARGQEETLAIARRQAATTLRRALPPSYRIALDLVEPHEAWRFPVDGRGEPLGSLLRRLRLPAGKRTESRVLETFADLFDLQARLAPDVARCYREALRNDDAEARESEARPDEPLLHHVGRLALTLPARTLQDLWHAVRREVMCSAAPTTGAAPEQGEPVVRIASEMLRNAIDESDLPAWASELLHHRILRQDDQGRVCLDLTGKPIRRSKRTSLHGVLQAPPRAPGGNGTGAHARVLGTEVHLRRFHEVVLVLEDLEVPGREAPLPANVAGWFMVLHDVLMLFERPRVLSADVTALEMSPEMIATVHEFWSGRARGEPFVQAAFWWTPPSWNTFIEFAILTAQWRAFLVRLSRGFLTAGDGEDATLRARFIQAAWVENICSVAGMAMGQWNWGDERQGAMSVLKASRLTLSLERYEQWVRDAVAELVTRIRKHSAGYDRLWTAQVWLRDMLPLQVLPEFALAFDARSLLRQPSGVSSPNEGWDILVKDWRTQAPRLAAFRHQRVRDAVNRSSAAESLRQALGAGGGRASETYYGWLDTLVDAWFAVVDHDGDPLAGVVLGLTPHLNPPSPDDHP
ncbi:ATP-binding protein [Corallococcus sp. AB038B]|uniref:ATP-binding protein n=1 Tax=Corallococcus sp. AB038B TaxID=2316718 RepID=UPI000ECA3C8D|nr:ATP-binding protein [Corallococcus sp. AB038B]RKI01883.1 ATP-binding protein [Corallococcus sp. AB038B]